MKIHKAFHPGSFTEKDLQSVDSFMQTGFLAIRSHMPNNFIWTSAPQDQEYYVGHVVIVKADGDNYNDVFIVSEADEDDIKGEFGDSLLLIPIYVSSKPKSFGKGSKQYLVSVDLHDVYSVLINADSEEDAIAQSENVPVYDWHHEDIEPNKPTRKVEMFAKWWKYRVERV